VNGRQSVVNGAGPAGEHSFNEGSRTAAKANNRVVGRTVGDVPEEKSVAAAAAPRKGALPAGAEDVLAALRSAWIVLDRTDRVVRSSPSALPYGLVRGKRVRIDTLLVLARQVRRDGQVREIEIEVPKGHRGTELVSLDVRLAPLGDAVLVLAEDHTALRRLDAVRRDFVANVSHELKTPVGALALLAEAVLGSADDPAAVRRFAGRMQHESNRLTLMVQDLISLSRLQNSDPLRGASIVNVDDVVAEAVDTTHLEADARQIRLEVRGQHGLSVLGDEEQLSTAVRNLIANAINYSPDHTRVTIGVSVVDSVVEIGVADQGIGIPEPDLERIFERFYRVDPARSRATGGTGLGLSIVKHVSVNHGGEVRVWSSEGSGSTFTLRLPAHTDSWQALSADQDNDQPEADQDLSDQHEVLP
jgi:two-component system, OmpR family, sensor histidine kinase SenX3